MASVLIDPEALVADFAASAYKGAITGWPCRLRTELVITECRPPRARGPARLQLQNRRL